MAFVSSSPASGQDGRTILNGTVDPTTEGADGDFYINTLTSTLFGAKSGGVWPAGVALVGQSFGNFDGGSPSSTYGGVSPVDGGGP